MKREAKTIRWHKELILNWFRAKKQFSSGIVEGLNNKVKLTIRKSYGFKKYKSIKIALYHFSWQASRASNNPHILLTGQKK